MGGFQKTRAIGSPLCSETPISRTRDVRQQGHSPAWMLSVGAESFQVDFDLHFGLAPVVFLGSQRNLDLQCISLTTLQVWGVQVSLAGHLGLADLSYSFAQGSRQRNTSTWKLYQTPRGTELRHFLLGVGGTRFSTTVQVAGIAAWERHHATSCRSRTPLPKAPKA